MNKNAYSVIVNQHNKDKKDSESQIRTWLILRSLILCKFYTSSNIWNQYQRKPFLLIHLQNFTFKSMKYVSHSMRMKREMCQGVQREDWKRKRNS